MNNNSTGDATDARNNEIAYVGATNDPSPANIDGNVFQCIEVGQIVFSDAFPIPNVMDTKQ